jgi:signal transduction histidine kinase
VRTPGHRWRVTIRLRLTLLYAGAFFLAGTVLIALMYFTLSQVLNHQSAATGTLQHLSPDLGHVFRTESQRQRADILDTMLAASVVLLAVVGLGAGGVGWLLAGRALRPLAQVTATARRVADRSLHERIALEGPDDEIRDLADTFDAMLERLDRAFDSQGRFVANASHELRTPLAINRTLIEVALEDPHASRSMRQLGANLLAVNQRHERLIDGLLTLASSAERINEPTLVDLADVARHVTTRSRDDAWAAGIDIRTSLAPAPLRGDPVLLERLVQNLVDNAVRYNAPDHGWVAVTTGVAEAAEAAAHLTVENTGPSIPVYEVPGLFEPFRRLPGSDPLTDADGQAIGRGAGLGLSIVQTVARAHGGEVHASPREEGGLVVRVRLPVTPMEIARNGG